MAETVAETEEQPPEGRSSKGKTNWAVALIVTLCLAFGNWALEYTSVGDWLQSETYSGLAALLPKFEDPLQVVVVNIHALPSYDGHPVSREALRQIITTIALDKPTAIGLDIDYSPFDYTPPSKEDGEFFQFCSDIRQGKDEKGNPIPPVPVFLGVSRTHYDSPEFWLGYTDYNMEAADIGIPHTDTRRMLRWITGPKYGNKVALRSLAEALAEAHIEETTQRKDGPMPGPGRLGSLVETIPASPFAEDRPSVGGIEEEIGGGTGAGSHYSLSPINYSKLEELKRETQTVTMNRDQAQFDAKKYQGRIVLIGDTDASDTFNIPGPLQPVRGVYLHACAAYTFTQQPLYEFRPSVRITLDIALSIALIFLLSRLDALKLKEMERHSRETRTHLLTLGAVFVACWLLVRYTGILWLDFIAIIIGLALHPAAEKGVHNMLASRFEKRHPHQIADHPQLVASEEKQETP